jgi:hypothetical protein
MPARPVAALIGIVAALLLTGCSEAPWVQAAAPDQIVLRWYPRSPETGDTEAQSKADAHCALTGRRAVLSSIERSGSAQRAIFLCE